MSKGTLRGVYGDMGEVGAAEPLELCIQVGKVPTLKQRVVGKINSGYDVLRAKGHLLGLREKIIDTTVEHEPTDPPNRHLLLRDDFGSIEHVEVEFLGEIFIEELQAKFPLGIVAHLDRVPKISSMKIGIGAINLDGFVPDHRL
jgi:hypothetical protein